MVGGRPPDDLLRGRIGIIPKHRCENFSRGRSVRACRVGSWIRDAVMLCQRGKLVWPDGDHLASEIKRIYPTRAKRPGQFPSVLINIRRSCIQELAVEAGIMRDRDFPFEDVRELHIDLTERRRFFDHGSPYSVNRGATDCLSRVDQCFPPADFDEVSVEQGDTNFDNAGRRRIEASSFHVDNCEYRSRPQGSFSREDTHDKNNT